MTPHKNLSFISHSSRMQISSRNLFNRKFTKRLQLFWFISIHEIPKPKLPKHIQSPTKNKSIRSKSKTMLPPTGHLNNLNPIKTTFNQFRQRLFIQLLNRRFQILRALAKLTKTISTPTIQHIIMVISNSMMKPSRNPFKFASNIIRRKNKCFKITLRAFSLPIISKQVSISPGLLLVTFRNFVS